MENVIYLGSINDTGDIIWEHNPIMDGDRALQGAWKSIKESA